MTRRSMLFGMTFLAALFAACKSKTETLSLLVWEGYADPSFLQPFEQSHHCKVVAAYMGSSDELVAKLRGGSASNYDVISPSGDIAGWRDDVIVRSAAAAQLGDQLVTRAHVGGHDFALMTFLEGADGRGVRVAFP